METSKIKNLIIYILLFVNLFLAGLVLSDRIQTRQAEETADAAIRTILGASGITLSTDKLFDNSKLHAYDVSRDLEQEKELVTAILGKVSVSEQRGNRLYYYNEDRGQASFRSTGDFEMLLNPGVVPTSGDNVETARSVLKKMGLDGEYDAQASEGDTVVMTCRYKDSPVVNCQIRFTFASDFLLMITGTRLLDVQREDDTVTILDAATLLSRFIGVIDRNGYVCNEILDISAVYLYTPAASGGELVPVWQIETNTNTFYLNVSTGEEQTLA